MHFSMKIYEFQLQFHWSLFLRVQLTTFKHWFRWWLGADQATSHYLNQWWHRLPTHICITLPQWVKPHFVTSGHLKHMMTSSNGNFICVTGPLCREYTSQRWINFTKAVDTDLWCFRWFSPEQTVEKTIKILVIWDVIVLIKMSL